MSFPRTYAYGERKRPTWVEEFNRRAPYTFVTGTPMRTRQIKRPNPYQRMGNYAKKPRVIPPRPFGFQRLPAVPRTVGGAVGEMKYFDVLCDNQTIAASDGWASTVNDPTGTNCLFAPTVGAGANQRIGKGCKIRKLKIKGSIRIPQQSGLTTAPAAVNYRLLLVQDKQTNASQMTGAQLMTATAVGGVVAVNVYQNIDNFGRFRVWKDKKFKLGNLNYAGTTPNITASGDLINFKFNLNFPDGLEVRFNNVGGGTVADIIDNSFHIVCNSSSNTLGATISYVCRVAFKE